MPTTFQKFKEESKSMDETSQLNNKIDPKDVAKML